MKTTYAFFILLYSLSSPVFGNTSDDDHPVDVLSVDVVDIAKAMTPFSGEFELTPEQMAIFPAVYDIEQKAKATTQDDCIHPETDSPKVKCDDGKGYKLAYVARITSQKVKKGNHD